jgi:hypothetical protein
MEKYWWIIRTDIICKCKCAFSKGLPYDTYIEWYNIPKLIYWLAKYISKKSDYSLTFTWVDMDSNIGESSLFVLKRRR